MGFELSIGKFKKAGSRATRRLLSSYKKKYKTVERQDELLHEIDFPGGKTTSLLDCVLPEW